VSRIASGKIMLRKERANLRDAVASAVESVRPLVDASAQRLEVHLPDEPLFVHGDPARLAQVVANLLGNASKYTERGGRIALSMAKEEDAAVIRVRDSGVGLSRDQMSRIFVMFSQIDPSLEREQSGLGVGLALAKTLVELHGGRIDVRSEGLGKGSEFTVRFPIVQGAPAPETPRHEPIPTTPARRILVADDNVDSARMLELVLATLGHQVLTVHDGLAALEAVSTFGPDLALLDIGMPKKNGYDVARELRARLGDGITLVALTGWGKEDDKKRALDSGFDHHLTKPVDFQMLERLVASPARLHSPRRS
jgi:CheY-like chemotaxis protein